MGFGIPGVRLDGIKAPDIGLTIGENTVNDAAGAATGAALLNNPATAALAGGAALGAALGGIGGLDIKDPAGMQQYTDLANQAQQEYGMQRDYLHQNVDPKRKALLDSMQAQANGTAPSIAEAQLRSSFDKSLQQQLALARSGAGRGNAGLQGRNVSNIAAQQAQNLGAQGAIEKLKEQQLGQQNLQANIQNEQAYATGTLGSALGSQANVAAMQNAQRDRNDKRTGGIIGAIGQAAGLSLAYGGKVGLMAHGGQVPSLEDMLKTKYGKSPKKMAYGGQYQADVGNVSQFVNDAAKQDSASSPTMANFSMGLLKKGKGALDKKQESDDDNALDDLVNGFEEENKLAEQENSINSFVPTMGMPGQQIMQNGMLPMSRAMPMSNGGNVPGQSSKAGDSLQNDKVPTLLSPGEIVVPRSVIEKGHVAAAYFVKKASEDSSYNAKDFKAEKKSLASMLKEISDGEERYKKVNELLKKGK